MADFVQKKRLNKFFQKSKKGKRLNKFFFPLRIQKIGENEQKEEKRHAAKS